MPAPAHPARPVRFSASPLVALLPALLPALLLAPLACNPVPADTPCAQSADCLVPGDLCVLGVCRPQVAPDAVVSAECARDNDCGTARRCVSGACYDNDCGDGQTRPCATQCGEGTQLCAGGVWRACSAQPTNELCGTGEDEDCDGLTDEACGGCRDGDVRPCATACGGGQERCVGGQFVGCDAPRPRLEACGDPADPADEDCDGLLDEMCADCRDGDARACDYGCGQGRELCRDRTWRDCDAPAPRDELCDARDNDCDGAVDEDITRDCSTLCGPGGETCAGGQWVGCGAPDACTCADNLMDLQACGRCGARARSCDGGVWSAWGACVEQPQCEPGAEERVACGQCGAKRRQCGATCGWGEWTECIDDAACAPGERQEAPCPSGCGRQARVCGEDCQWGAWGPCDAPAPECDRGQTETAPCERCGARARACTDQCAWGPWGPCEAQGACEPGDVGYDPCPGSCVAREKTCTAQCQWGAPGACEPQGACAPGQPDEVRACGQCGEERRACTASCVWGDWGACDAPADACAPGDTERAPCGTDVGVCAPGVQARACGASCAWGAWGACEGGVRPLSADICGNGLDDDCDGVSERRPDSYEGLSDNNACARCATLGGGGQPITLTATLDSVEDEWDYYCVQVVDGISVISETLDVSLTRIPAGVDYDLYLYKSVAECAAGRELASSRRAGSADDAVSWTESYWDDDGGVFVVGVRRGTPSSYSCTGAYTLTIDTDL